MLLPQTMTNTIHRTLQFRSNQVGCMRLGKTNACSLHWLIVFLLTQAVNCGIIPYNLLLQPKYDSVQFDSGFIRAPGYIDLSGLTFGTVAKNDAAVVGNDNNVAISSSSEFINDDLDELRIEAESLARASLKEQLQFTANDAISESDDRTSKIDIAIFQLPSQCASTGCDWSKLGVGKRKTETGEVFWCCSDESIGEGYCSKNDTGRLLIDTRRYRGDLFTLQVPQQGIFSETLQQGKTIKQLSGAYVLLYANCNDKGRPIYITGQSTWKSKHGYLPGELYGFMMFYGFVSLIYVALFAGFGTLMHIYKDSRIEIEKWIVISIGMGLSEMIFRSGDYFIWNTFGTRSTTFVWISFLVGAFKQGISRCLLVMVSMGWGVTRDTLGVMMSPIILFGAAYIGTEIVIDSMIAFASTNGDTISSNVENGIVGTVALLSSIKFMIDAIFIIFVLESLRRTILLLTKLNQTGKLARTCHLRNVMLCSVIFNVCSVVSLSYASYRDKIEEGGMNQTQSAWTKAASTELNYLFVLIGIAILWHPNQNARQYVYTMELPTSMEHDKLLDRSSRGIMKDCNALDCSSRGNKDDVMLQDRSSRGTKDPFKCDD
jgi:Lung seven transmembrane receptor